jgi:hypothetical protein
MGERARARESARERDGEREGEEEGEREGGREDYLKSLKIFDLRWKYFMKLPDPLLPL